MQYPQAYLLIDKQFELPSIETLQIWCKSKSPVYIQGVSEKNESMEARINNILRFMAIWTVIHITLTKL